jgi:hypothetical protein
VSLWISCAGSSHPNSPLCEGVAVTAGVGIALVGNVVTAGGKVAPPFPFPPLPELAGTIPIPGTRVLGAIIVVMSCSISKYIGTSL